MNTMSKRTTEKVSHMIILLAGLANGDQKEALRCIGNMKLDELVALKRFCAEMTLTQAFAEMNA